MYHSLISISVGNSNYLLYGKKLSCFQRYFCNNNIIVTDAENGIGKASLNSS